MVKKCDDTNEMNKTHFDERFIVPRVRLLLFGVRSLLSGVCVCVCALSSDGTMMYTNL